MLLADEVLFMPLECEIKWKAALRNNGTLIVRSSNFTYEIPLFDEVWLDISPDLDIIVSEFQYGAFPEGAWLATQIPYDLASEIKSLAKSKGRIVALSK